jgi:arsenate reductase (glutaredoxin)
MAAITVHLHPTCTTCRKAVHWLRDHKIAFVERSIRDTPPTPAGVRTMLRLLHGDLRRLFNTSGLEYRALGLKDKVATMTEDEAIALLASNGMLVRRPFLLRGKSIGLVGFDPDKWKQALANVGCSNL